MVAKKKSVLNGNVVIIILQVISAAIVAGAAVAIEGITKRILTKKKGGRKPKTKS